MSTRTTLSNAIASDLHRSDLSTQISTAIDSAIRHYERESFWFLEGRAELTTSANQKWYGPPSDLKGFDSLLVTISGSKEPVDRVHYSEIDENDPDNITGIPSEWAFYQDNLRFYPTPNQAYVLTLSYRRSLPTETASASTSWTNEGFDLIRFHSEQDVYSNYLKDPDSAAIAEANEAKALLSLQRENTNKVATGKIKKGSW